MSTASLSSRASAAVVTALAVGAAAGLSRPVVAGRAPRGGQAAGTWQFVMSGDARNCGDVVVPAIAATAARVHAAFFWHLGDLRQTTNFDEDMVHQPEHLRRPLTVSAYLNGEWSDFVENQVAPFGDTPVFIGIGNHDVIPPKTREAFTLEFADWLDSPVLRAQRLKDDPRDYRVKTYYHWIDRGVAFYFLDNASLDMFDAAQIRWFERTLAKDEADPAVAGIVVAMHKPLPDGFAGGHSMNESPTSTETGRRVYADLLKARDTAHKHVYTVASHQHFFMEDAYDTPYWREHGGVVPGWIVGTAGAVRYPLPAARPKVALENVYGSIVATVHPDGTIAFAFDQIDEPDVPASVVSRYGQEFVHWCFAQNRAGR
jgi:Calcineurin-like phosphoesterase